MVTTARSREDLARRNAQIQSLNELGQAMNSGLDLDESLELIAARAAEALGAKGSAIRLFVADGTLALATLYSQSAEGIDSTYERRIADFVAATGAPPAERKLWSPGLENLYSKNLYVIIFIRIIIKIFRTSREA